MTVSELIDFLKTQPQDLEVAHKCFSEHLMLESFDIQILDLCEARNDGWIQNRRPDKPTKPYLVFPGN